MNNNGEQIEEKIVQIVQEVLEKKVNFSPQDNLQAFGLDSLSGMKLVVTLEEQFNITVDDSELLIENFDTLEKILHIITSKNKMK